jgi:hypothetical protein
MPEKDFGLCGAPYDGCQRAYLLREDASSTGCELDDAGCVGTGVLGHNAENGAGDAARNTHMAFWRRKGCGARCRSIVQSMVYIAASTKQAISIGMF